MVIYVTLMFTLCVFVRKGPPQILVRLKINSEITTKISFIWDYEYINKPFILKFCCCLCGQILCVHGKKGHKTCA